MDESLEFTLSGRLRNIVLAPSAKNCIVPLFEAITNSIHAIEDRFGKDSLKKGRIEIIVNREDDKIESFRVDDNGEGLTPQNYKSFLTSDSTKKISRGGKGVGRLTWLKVFGKIAIDSYYVNEGQTERLSFKFVQDDASPIRDKSITLADIGAGIGTSLRMEDMQPTFQARRPKRKGTIADEIVRHFISYMVAEDSPRFSFYDFEDRTDLSEYFADAIRSETRETLQIRLDESHVVDLNIHHLRVDKRLRDSEIGYNTIYLNAHGRNVDRYDIDTQLGLQSLHDDCVYMAVVSSDFLDEFVSQERTFFAVDADDMGTLKKGILEAAKNFLFSDIAAVRKDQIEKTGKIVDQNPRFMSIVEDVGNFVEQNIPLHIRSDEDIHLSLERQYRRERNKYAREFLQAKQSRVADAIDKKLKQYVGFLNDDVKYTLAEYIIRRKAVLDAVLEAQAYEDESKKRHHLEEVIHSYICPLRSTSDDMTYEGHNLWVIDDRLAFYNYFASDKPIKSFQPSNPSRKEPDITLFDVGLGLRREHTDQPVVIVEFKRPGRPSYGADRPVEQLLKYVKSLRENGSLTDKNGRTLATINTNTWFIGYVIADLTEGFKETLIGSVVNKPTADGNGLWGYEENLRTHIEVIPYEKLFRDARTRNEVFFSKLRLQS